MGRPFILHRPSVGLAQSSENQTNKNVIETLYIIFLSSNQKFVSSKIEKKIIDNNDERKKEKIETEKKN